MQVLKRALLGLFLVLLPLFVALTLMYIVGPRLSPSTEMGALWQGVTIVSALIITLYTIAVILVLIVLLVLFPVAYGIDILRGLLPRKEQSKKKTDEELDDNE